MLSRDHIHVGKRTTEREVNLNGSSSLLLANHMFATQPGPLTNLIHKELRHQLQTASSVDVCRGHDGFVTCVCFSSDGRTIASCGTEDRSQSRNDRHYIRCQW